MAVTQFVREHGRVLNVTDEQRGSFLVQDELIAATTIHLDDVTDYDEHGGLVAILGTVYTYDHVDDDANTLHLTSGLVAATIDLTPVTVSPAVYDRWALLRVDDVYGPSEGTYALVPFGLYANLPPGQRDQEGSEWVTAVKDGDTWKVQEVTSDDSGAKPSTRAGHNHQGEGIDSTILSGLSDSVQAQSPGDEGLAGGVGAVAFGADSVVLGAYSSDVDLGSYENIIFGTHNAVYGQKNILAGQTILFGDLASNKFSHDSLVLVTGTFDRVGYDWFNSAWHEVDSSILIGYASFLNPPAGAGNGSFLSVLDAPYEVLNLTSVDFGTSVWGENILNVNASTYTADNFVLGRDLISIGPNWVARETGPFDGSQIYDPYMFKSFAIGIGNFVSGDESSVIGYVGATSRGSHMLLYAGDGGAISLGSVLELSHDPYAFLLDYGGGYPTTYDSGVTRGVIQSLRPHDADITFTLKDIHAPAQGGRVYDGGTYPDGNDYLNGKAIGTYYIIKKTDASAHKVIVQPESGTLDGATNIQLTNQWDYVEVIALLIRTSDSGTFTYSQVWTVLSGRVGGVPI